MEASDWSADGLKLANESEATKKLFYLARLLLWAGTFEAGRRQIIGACTAKKKIELHCSECYKNVNILTIFDNFFDYSAEVIDFLSSCYSVVEPSCHYPHFLNFIQFFSSVGRLFFINMTGFLPRNVRTTNNLNTF